jgi:hypothetical protein
MQHSFDFNQEPPTRTELYAAAAKAIDSLTASTDRFSAWDVRQHMISQGFSGEGWDLRAMGPILKKFDREGKICSVGFQKTKNPSRNGGIETVWAPL